MNNKEHHHVIHKRFLLHTYIYIYMYFVWYASKMKYADAHWGHDQCVQLMSSPLAEHSLKLITQVSADRVDRDIAQHSCKCPFATKRQRVSNDDVHLHR